MQILKTRKLRHRRKNKKRQFFFTTQNENDFDVLSQRIDNANNLKFFENKTTEVIIQQDSRLPPAYFPPSHFL